MPFGAMHWEYLLILFAILLIVVAIVAVAVGVVAISVLVARHAGTKRSESPSSSPRD